MSRYRRYLYRDDEPQRDGDTGFMGVNAKASPERLAAGWVREARNLSFTANVAATRGGASTPVFGRLAERTDAGDPALFCGAGVFSDPNGYEWLLIATDAGVWQIRSGHNGRLIPTPEELIGGTVEFVQAFDRVLLFRGAEKIPWQWDGDRHSSFEPIEVVPATDGTAPIPYGSDRAGLLPVLLNSRLIVPHERTKIAVSDILDYTNYDPAFANFDVTTGNDDTLTALYPYVRGTVLCFKDQSIAAVSGIAGTLEARLDVINHRIGCVAGKTVAMVGGDVFFLSATGVFRLQEIVQERLQTEPVAVSDPIEPIIARIYWPYASVSVAAVLGEYYYLAVPLDGSDVPNAILPYNARTGAWEGVHTWPDTQIDALLVSDHQSRRMLYAIDYRRNRVLRLYDGRTDRIGATEHEIECALATRGYLLGDNQQKMVRRAAVSVETWHPSYTVAAETDGVEESRPLGGPNRIPTRSRTKYHTFATPPYVRSNVNDDHGAPRREDYSVALDVPFIPGSGVAMERHQIAQERFAVGRRARWVSLRITSTQGSTRIVSTEVQGDETQRSLRTTT